MLCVLLVCGSKATQIPICTYDLTAYTTDVHNTHLCGVLALAQHHQRINNNVVMPNQNRIAFPRIVWNIWCCSALGCWWHTGGAPRLGLCETYRFWSDFRSGWSFRCVCVCVLYGFVYVYRICGLWLWVYVFGRRTGWNQSKSITQTNSQTHSVRHYHMGWSSKQNSVYAGFKLTIPSRPSNNAHGVIQFG